MTEQQAAQARRSSRKCRTKPMEIGHKPFTFKGLTYNIFGFAYAKRTQFRGSRTGHRRAGHAGSWQADKLGLLRISMRLRPGGRQESAKRRASSQSEPGSPGQVGCNPPTDIGLCPVGCTHPTKIWDDASRLIRDDSRSGEDVALECGEARPPISGVAGEPVPRGPKPAAAVPSLSGRRSPRPRPIAGSPQPVPARPRWLQRDGRSSRP